jgi:hypothetical protein
MRTVAAVLCLAALACSTSSRGTADGGGSSGGSSSNGSDDGGGGGGGDGGASDVSRSLGVQAKGTFTHDRLAREGQIDVAFTFSPLRKATRLQTSGGLCSALSLDADTAYPAVLELANTDTSPLSVSLFSAFSRVEALVVYDVRPETSESLLQSCVAVAASEGVSRYGFSQSSPSTFAIAPGGSLYVYAQRGEDLYGEEQGASVSVTLAR